MDRIKQRAEEMKKKMSKPLSLEDYPTSNLQDPKTAETKKPLKAESTQFSVHMPAELRDLVDRVVFERTYKESRKITRSEMIEEYIRRCLKEDGVL